MKCIIIEDEIPAQRLLLSYLKKIPHIEVLGCFNSAIKANDTLLNHDVDVMFLDINLPDISGMNYLSIIDKSPLVVITTAYSEYAVESFEKDRIVDYLMKPFSFERFLKATNKVADRLENNMRINQPNQRVESDNHIFVNIDKTLHKILFDDISYIMSEHNYITIQTKERKYTFVDTLKNWCTKLPSQQFIQIHKSYIINCKKITKISGNKVITLAGTLPIGRHFKEQFVSQLKL
jgi:DNA-binding LytR/AlgR family response regulator